MNRQANTIKIFIALMVVLFIITVSAMNAQTKTGSGSNYSNAFGLRIGGTSALTYKHKFSSSNALEVMLQFTPGAAVLFEKHYAAKTAGLEWYLGAGAHVAAYRSNRYYVFVKRDKYYYYKDDYYGPAIGIDGIAGLEYKITDVPLAFSLDVKPNVEFTSDNRMFMFLDPGISVKAAF